MTPIVQNRSQETVCPQKSCRSAIAVTSVVARRAEEDSWTIDRRSQIREYTEVVAVIGLVTAIGSLLPLTYHTFGLIYLLVVIVLSLRVGRWPVLTAAIVSALVWDYVFVPPAFSFAVPEPDDGLLLGTYVTVALVAGQLTARVRAQQRREQLRERRATALFHVIRAITEARTVDEAIRAALRQSDSLFDANTALLLANANEPLIEHRASSLKMREEDFAIADWSHASREPAGRFTNHFPETSDLFLPVVRAGKIYGVFVVRLPSGIEELPPMQRELIEGFAAQIASLLEREELKAASEREKLFAESDRLRRTLLDSISHELKTPLSVLRSAGEKLDVADSAKRATLTDEIRTATRRLDHLVANLLNQTRLESGAVQPQLDWCDARDLISAARRAMGDRLTGRSFTIQIPLDMPLLMVDAPLMEQVLENLLSNACLHTPESSPLVFSAGVEKGPKGERAFLKLQDRGPGIPPGLRKKLFQKFVRGPQARSGGVGLGLAIAQGFVDLQGGEIEVSDNPGGGACFTIYLSRILYETVPNDER